MKPVILLIAALFVLSWCDDTLPGTNRQISPHRIAVDLTYESRLQTVKWIIRDRALIKKDQKSDI